MAKELLGTAVTDENGIATFTYTGQGRGKMNIVAESGELVSVPYSVLDTLYYDKGLEGTGNHNDAMWCNIFSTHIDRGADGTTLTTESAWGGIQVGTTTSAQAVPLPCVLEFEVLEMTTGNTGDFIQIKDFNSNNMWYANEGIGVYRIELRQNSQIQTINGQSTPSGAVNLGESVRIFFGSTLANDTFKFKDLKIYPI